MFRWYQNTSLRNKIITIVLFISFVTTLISALFSYNFELKQYENNLIQSTITDAQLISQYCVMPLEFGFPDKAQEVLEKLRSKPGIYNGIVFDTQDSLFAAYHKDSVQTFFPSASLLQDSVYFEDDFLHVIQPIVYQDKDYGKIYLRAHTNINQISNRRLYISLLLIFCMGLIAFVMAHFLQKLVTNPIRKLTKFTAQISATNNYGFRIEQSSNDETGRLYKEFNHLLQTVQDSHRERDNALISLRKSEAEFKLLFEQGTDAIYVHDYEGRILDANIKAYTSLGYTHSEIQTKKIMDIDANYPNIKDLIPIWNSLDNKSSLTIEGTHVRKDGTTFPVEVHLSAIEHDNNRRIIAFVIDVTERKLFENTLIEKNNKLSLAEARTRAINEEIRAVNEELQSTSEALAESEEKHRSLIEKMNVGLGILNLQGFFIFANPKLCNMLEYEADELSKIHINQLVENSEFLETQLKKRTNGEAQSYELTWITKSKQLIITEIVPTVLYDNNNNMIGSQSIITDITEKKKTQQELEQYRNNLEEKVLQRTSEIEKLNKKLLATNEEIKFTNEELYKQQQNLQNTVVQLQQAQNQLLQSEKMAALGVLIAGIAHEINNPVNFINTGLAGFQRNYKNIENLLAQYRALPVSSQEIASIKDFETKNKIDFQVELMQKMLKNIEIGVQRTTEIVKSLRAFAHNNENIFDIADIHESIDNTLIILHHQYKERIEIVKQYKPLPKIPCYPAQINQVFMNIITNAIQAIHDKGNITISTFKHDNYVGISISDTGNGIRTENLTKIFDPFFTTKEVGKGTGLGLSITYKIVKEHNGNIEVKSSIGVGTEFLIYLPVK